MKRAKYHILVLAVTLLTLLTGTLANADTGFKSGDKFANSSLGLGQNSYILECQSADIDNDGVIEDVLLIGDKEKESSIYVDNISLFMYDRNSKVYTKLNYGDYNGGYGADLFLGDFTNDSIPEVMISIPTGGTGGTSVYSIVSASDFNHTGKSKILFDQDMSQGFKYDIQFKDNYKVDVVSLDLNKTDTIDVSINKANYDQMGIYKDGKLVKTEDGSVDGYSELEPINLYKDTAWELHGRQYICGIGHADGIALVDTIIKYKDGEFKLMKFDVSTSFDSPTIHSGEGVYIGKIDNDSIEIEYGGKAMPFMSSEVKNAINKLAKRASVEFTYIIDQNGQKVLKTINTSSQNITPSEINSSLGLGENSYILECQSADIDNDGVIEDVFLVGDKEKDSGIYVKNISLFMYDRNSKVYTRLNYGDFNRGYGASLFLGDFTNDSIPEVMISIRAGGSGATSVYSIISANDFNRTGKTKILFDQVMSRGFKFNIQFKDNYKVDVVSLDLNRTDTIDISKNKADYDRLGIYKDGKLVEEEPCVYAFDYTELEPINLYKDTAWELQGMQYIISYISHKDFIASIDTIIKYKDGEFKLMEFNVSTSFDSPIIHSGKGVYVGKVDNDSVEIEYGDKVMTFISYEVKNAINKLANRTPVEFTYIIDEDGQKVLKTINAPSQNITTGEIDFKVISNTAVLSSDAQKKLSSLTQRKGYSVIYNKYGVYQIYIGLGEKPTGGYSIAVKSVEDIEGITKIIVECKEPKKGQPIIQSITYPYTIIEVKDISPKFEVVSTNGDRFQSLNSSTPNDTTTASTMFDYMLGGLKMKMTTEQVSSVIGSKPFNVVEEQKGTIEKWYYDNDSIITFTNGIVTSIQLTDKSFKAAKDSKKIEASAKNLIKSYGKNSKKVKGVYTIDFSDKNYHYYAEAKGNKIVKLTITMSE